MTDHQLEALLAQRLLGWRAAPDRFLLGKRRWTPRWRFQPAHNLEHARQLLGKAGARYSITKSQDGTVTATVTVEGRSGTVTGKSEPSALTHALALALGIAVEESR